MKRLACSKAKVPPPSINQGLDGRASKGRYSHAHSRNYCNAKDNKIIHEREAEVDKNGEGRIIERRRKSCLFRAQTDQGDRYDDRYDDCFRYPEGEPSSISMNSRGIFFFFFFKS